MKRKEAVSSYAVRWFLKGFGFSKNDKV